MPNVTPDPYGDRNCHMRWDHREMESIVVDGIPMCPECYVPEN